MKYNKNKNIQITFTIRENLYFRFKTLCKAEKKMPATVLKEFIKNYVERKELECDGNDECFDGNLWDDVMFDFFPQAKDEADIEDELDDLWNRGYTNAYCITDDLPGSAT